MLQQYETLKVEVLDQHILIVTLNRPKSLNALNTQMGMDLYDLWAGLYQDQQDIRCAVLTGSGERAFCAGGDLKERNGMSDETWRKQHAIFEQAFIAMLDSPVPIIGAVNGAAFGGGAEMVSTCDFAYASYSARFGFPEGKLGIMLGCSGTQTFPRAVGIRRAKEVLLTASPFNADDALAWGFVNKLCAPESLLEEATATAKVIAGNAPMSMVQLKKSINVSAHTDVKTGYMFEIEAYNRLVPTEDRLEGVRAFNEKRKPKFRGR